MATSNAIITAAQDRELQERFVAIAAEQGITDPQSFVYGHSYQLACAPVSDSGDTVASVYEYADGQYKAKQAELKTPGKDPASVTDDHLRHAIAALRG